jgi:integrase
MEYLIALVERWREEAVLLETRYGSPELAALARAFADELAAATGRVGDAVWSVSRAATETGRSRGHIYALIEEGGRVSQELLQLHSHCETPMTTLPEIKIAQPPMSGVLGSGTLIYLYKFHRPFGDITGQLYTRPGSSKVQAAIILRSKRYGAFTTGLTREELKAGGRTLLVQIGLRLEQEATKWTKGEAAEKIVANSVGITWDGAIRTFVASHPNYPYAQRVLLARTHRVLTAIWPRSLALALIDEDHLDELRDVLRIGGWGEPGTADFRPLEIAKPLKGQCAEFDVPSALIEGCKPATDKRIREILRTLARVWRWCARKDFVTGHPFKGRRTELEKLRPTQRRLAVDDFSPLLAVADNASQTRSNAYKNLREWQAPTTGRTFLLLVRETGMRRTEATRLRRRDILLTARAAQTASEEHELYQGDAAAAIGKTWIHGGIHSPAPNRKAKKGRGVAHLMPLSPTLRAALDAHMAAMPAKNPEAWLFPSPTATERRARGLEGGFSGTPSAMWSKTLWANCWKLARETIGRDRRRGEGWHSLRRMRAAELRGLGWDLPTITALIGWTPEQSGIPMGDRYAGVDPKRVYAAACNDLAISPITLIHSLTSTQRAELVALLAA